MHRVLFGDMLLILGVNVGITPAVALTLFFFFFNDTATPEIYPFSLHDALPIFISNSMRSRGKAKRASMKECKEFGKGECRLAPLFQAQCVAVPPAGRGTETPSVATAMSEQIGRAHV